MSKPHSQAETIQFLLCCLMHTPGKTDTDAVARDLSLATGKTAYFRLWTLKKKYGEATGTGSPSINSTANGVTDTPRKRGRPRKEKPGNEGNGDDADWGSPVKRRKTNGAGRKGKGIKKDSDEEKEEEVGRDEETE